MEVSPDGKFTAAAPIDAPVIVFETESGRSAQQWDTPGGALGGGWTSDGHLLVGR
jgi:hypothetical protein